MPQIITLPSVTPTGYGQLGQVLLSGAADYAAEKRRSDEEARVRANQLADAARNRTNQLADVQSARDYSDKRFGVESAARLKDTEAEKLFAAKTEMMRLGYLQPNAFDNEAAVQAALTRMHNDGLLTKYQGALGSGDLSYEDLSSGDEKRINTGLAKFSQRLVKETTRQEASVTAAQETANTLQSQYDQVQSQASALELDLGRPIEESVKPASQQEVQNLAVQLARQATGGKQPSDKDIAAQLPVAQQQLQQQHLESAMLRKQQTQERVRLLKDQAQTLGVRLNTLATRGVFPAGKAPGGPSPLTDVGGAPAPTSASPDARQAAIQATIAKARGTPGAPATAAPAPTAASAASPAPWSVFSSPPVPEVTKSSPAAPGLGGARANEAIGDSMRAFGYGIGNVMRPSSWHGDMDSAFYQLSPEVEIKQLESRLAALRDRTSPTAVQIVNRLAQLRRSVDQLQTQNAAATLADPVSNTAETAPPAAGRISPFQPFNAPWWGGSGAQPAGL